MKKRIVLTLLALSVLTVSLLTLIPAQTAYDPPIEDGYLWLINQVDGKWTTLDTQNTGHCRIRSGENRRKPTAIGFHPGKAGHRTARQIPDISQIRGCRCKALRSGKWCR